MSKTKTRLFTVIISMLTLLALCFSMVGCSNTEKPTEQNNESQSVISGGMQVGETQNHGISLMSASIEPALYADYGISTAAETAVTINATITPSEVVEQGIDWALSWENPNDSWASGKNVTDYVSLNATGKTANVSCLQAFGEQIILTATAQANPTVKATCKFEYAQKVSNASLNIGNIPVNLGGNTNITYEIGKGVTGSGGVVAANVVKSEVYTVAESFTETVTITHDANSENWFRVKGSHPSRMATFNADISNYKGQTLYFDYDHDICNWMIMQRQGDIMFRDLTTAEIQDYLSNITIPTVGVINLTLTGAYGTYTYSSTIICNGYTNNTPISALTLDTANYVF